MRRSRLVIQKRTSDGRYSVACKLCAFVFEAADYYGTALQVGLEHLSDAHPTLRRSRNDETL